MAGQTPEEIALERIRECKRKKSKALDMPSKTLRTVPDELWDCVHLTHLNLFNNRLTSVSPKIWNLTNLVRLHLEGNRIAKLPPGISKLEQLRILGIDGNKGLVDTYASVALTVASLSSVRHPQERS